MGQRSSSLRLPPSSFYLHPRSIKRTHQPSTPPAALGRANAACSHGHLKHRLRARSPLRKGASFTSNPFISTSASGMVSTAVSPFVSSVGTTSRAILQRSRGEKSSTSDGASRQFRSLLHWRMRSEYCERSWARSVMTGSFRSRPATTRRTASVARLQTSPMRLRLRR